MATTAASATPTPTVRTHPWVSRSLVALASLLAFFAMFALWLNRQLLDTDNWTQASSQLLDDPAIRGQAAGYLTDQLFTNVDVQSEIASALPPRAQFLAQPAAGLLRDRVEVRANKLLTRPRVQQLWEDANRVAHQQLLRVLNGGGDVVSTDQGKVVLDMKAMLAQLEQQVGIGGRISDRLPPDAARLTVLESDNLATAQKAARVLDGLPIPLIVLSLLAFGAALLASPPDRRRTVRGFGIGLVLVGVAGLAAAALAGDLLVSSLAKTDSLEPAVRGVWDVYDTLLQQAATAAVLYGVLLIGGAWLAGPTGWAVTTRRRLSPYLRETALAYGAFAVLMIVVVAWWAPTPAMRNPATAILLVVLLAGGFEGLRRSTARDFPAA